MNKENLIDLLCAKFYSTDKKTQTKLLKFLLDVNDKDMLMDFLNGIKLKNIDKGFQEQDFIYVPFTISSYPSINKKYYEDNELIVNDLYIRCMINYINPVTSYVGLSLRTNDSEKDTVAEVYYGSIPNQHEIKLL